MYERLNVREGSSLAERKKAYRAITRLIHPDTVQDESAKACFNEALARVNEAYEILRDPSKESAWRTRQKPREKQRSNTESAERKSPPGTARTPEQELGREFERASFNGALNLDVTQIFELVERLLEKQHLSSYRNDPVLVRGVQHFIKAVMNRAMIDAELRPKLLHALVLLYKAMGFPLLARVGQKLHRTILMEIEYALTEKEAPKLLPHYLMLGAHLDAEWRKTLRNSPARPAFQRRLRAVFKSQRRTRKDEVERCFLFEMQERWAVCSSEWLRELQREIFKGQTLKTTSSQELRSTYEWLRIDHRIAYTIAQEELRLALEVVHPERALALISFIRYGLGEELPEPDKLGDWIERGINEAFTGVRGDNVAPALAVCHLIEGANKSLGYSPSSALRRRASVAATVCRRAGSKAAYAALRDVFKLSMLELSLGWVLSFTRRT